MLFSRLRLSHSISRKMVQEHSSKRPCIRIGTHNGTFHCDEALACFMLKQLPEYKDASIVRTRDSAQLAECDIVVDVGGVYDPATHRYDHHQRSFTGTMANLTDGKMNFNTKLSSAGLVYLHFGRRLLEQLMPNSNEDHKEIVYKRLYEYFMEEIDAVDNGINATEEKPKYHVTTTLGGRVRDLNPAWNDSNQDFDGQFVKATELVGSELVNRVDGMVNRWLPALDIVRKAFNKRHEVHSSGKIVKFETGGCPWKEHLYQLEKQAGCEGEVQYVIYSDSNGSWRVQAVGVQGEGFTSRLPLPESWRGVRDEKLSELTGIPECIFVHASGFIGGNKTEEGAMEMARQALQMK